MATDEEANEETKEVAERLRGGLYRVHFSLYGSLEVRAKNKEKAAEKAFEDYDWAEHVDGGEVVSVEEE